MAHQDIEERNRLEAEKREMLKEARRAKRKEEELEKLPKVGDMLWLEMRIDKRGKPYFLMPEKHIGKIVLNRKNYRDSDLRRAIRTVLPEVPKGQKLLCKVIALHTDTIGLRWMIESDPYAKHFPELKQGKILKLIQIIKNWLNWLEKKLTAKPRKRQ